VGTGQWRTASAVALLLRRAADELSTVAELELLAADRAGGDPKPGHGGWDTALPLGALSRLMLILEYRHGAVWPIRGKTRAVVFAHSSGYDDGMAAVPLGEVRDRLSEYVADVERTHERVTITRHGRPAAVLISADDLASIEETLEILGTPGAAQAIREGQADAASGRFADNAEIKARYGVA
jgi:prevent-host-death family protein